MNEQIGSPRLRKSCRTHSGFISHREPRRQPARASVELIEATRQLMERTIEFIPHPDFEQRGCARRIESMRPASLEQPRAIAAAAAGVVFVTGFVSAPCLTIEEERYWFTKMNFLKSRAEQNRRLLDLRRPDQSLVDRIRDDLKESLQIRNQIVAANLRLIVALAKKLAHSLETMSELISEGMTPLIRAAELFDIHLGNRFSTYATWAARNQMLRWLKRNRTLSDGISRKESPSLENLPDRRSTADATGSALHAKAAAINRLLATLSERERTIVAARFGLHGQPHGQSLADIARQIDLSKERVRQIALTSLEKLRECVVNQEVDEEI